MAQFNRLFFILILSSISFNISGQTAPHKYWIQFTDKNNTQYSINQPDVFLSPRSIERRQRYGIAIGTDDFPVNSNYLDSLRQVGATILTTSRWLNSATIYVSDTSIIEQIRNMSIVQQVYKNARVRPNRIPNQSLEKQIISPLNNSVISQLKNTKNENYLSSCNYDYGFAYRQINMINGDYLHQLGYCGSGILIGVIDAGFWGVNQIHAFDSLWMNNQIEGFIDFVDPMSNIFEQSTHGMMVLSIMGGNMPGAIVGTAPKASYWLIRSEDADTEFLIEEDNWVSAIEFADSAGVDVINSSLGYTTFDDTTIIRTYAQMTGKVSHASIAATIAGRKGMIVCNSAGNSGEKPWRYIGTPADADSILTVGAVDENRAVATFSSVGPSFDGRVKPEVATMGQQTWVVNQAGEPVSGNGTSFASPVLAGTVACLWQAFPNKSNYEIMDAIIRSADKYNQPDTLTGYGIPDFMIAYQILSLNVNIPKNEKNQLLSVFPNPFSDYFSVNIQSKSSTQATMEIYDSKGIQIYKSINLNLEIGENAFRFSDAYVIPKGMYFLKLNTADSSNVIRMIKIE